MKVLKYKRRAYRTIDGKVIKLEEPTEKISFNMRRIKSKDTSIEKILFAKFRENGISVTKPEYVIGNVEGNPDFLIPKYKIAIFCDGEFWHGHRFKPSEQGNNKDFWNAKIHANIKRDQKVNHVLKKQGWASLRFWEDDIKENPQNCVDIVKQLLDIKQRKSSSCKFTFIDLFSGIGGFRIALEELGGKCLGFSEISVASVNVYKNNFVINEKEQEQELGDITKFRKLPFEIDLVVGGVPCQSWSVAGKKRGFEDPRGRLWYDTIEVVKANKPKAFICENVKGLIDPRNRANLDLIVSEFEDAGYNVVPPTLLNSWDFGVPQNRDRVFVVGFRKDIKNIEQFTYPAPLNTKPKLYDLINDMKIEKDFKKKKFSPEQIFGGRVPASRNRFQKHDELNDFFIFCDTRDGHTTIHSWDIIKTTQREKDICYTILKNRRRKIYGEQDGNPISFEALVLLIPGLKRKELEALIKKRILRYVDRKGYDFKNSKNSSGINDIYRIFMPYSDIFSTLTATGTKDMIALKTIDYDDPVSYKQNFLKEIYRKKKYRAITGREAGKLQGFPDSFIIHETDATAKKQFGNAVSAPVIYNLAKQVIKTGVFEKES